MAQGKSAARGLLSAVKGWAECRRPLTAAGVILAATAFASISAYSAPKTGTIKISTIKVSAAKLAGHGAVSRPHVYLMRGLLNVFSLGMDQLATQIQSRGIDANVYNHSYEETVAAQIARMFRAGDHGPYILVGHSLGADAVMVMAQQLNAAGIPVALVVPFDGTGSYAAPRNVACVLNVTQRKYAYMSAGAGFHGMLQNVDVSNDASIDHFTIDKSPRLQAEALRYVLTTAHQETCRPGGAGTIEARPKEPVDHKPTAPARAATPVLRLDIAG